MPSMKVKAWNSGDWKKASKESDEQQMTTAAVSTSAKHRFDMINPYKPYTARKYDPNCSKPDHCLHTMLKAAKKNTPATIWKLYATSEE
jgi:hypothetical protein